MYITIRQTERHNETQPQDVITKLEADNSRLAKEAVLLEAMEEGLDEFFEGVRWHLIHLLHLVLNKYLRAYRVLTGQGLAWPVFKELARKLVNRSLTGHAARDAIILAMILQQQNNGTGFIDDLN